MRKRNLIQLLFVLLGAFALAACGPEENPDGPEGRELCTTAADCEDGEGCRSGICLPSCEADADCDGGVCNFGGVCVQECEEGAGDCPDGQSCSPGGVCWPEGVELATCGLDQDCAANEYCAEGACVKASCSEDADCGGRNICDTGRCRTGCRPEGEGATEETSCPEGEQCNAITNVCEAVGCTMDSCAEFQRCNTDTTPPACEYTGKCDQDAVCQAYADQIDSDIPLVCQEATNDCIEKPPCQKDSDCKADEICEVYEDKRNTCEEGCRCTDGCERDCATGQVCSEEQGNVCVQGCQSNEECKRTGKGDYCIDLECVPGCEGVDDCSVEGQTCRSGPGGGPRICRPCTDDNQCAASQFCNTDKGTSDEQKMDDTVGLCDALPPACPDDKFGDNQKQRNPYQVQNMPFSESPVFCREFQSGDWFTTSADSGKVIEISLTYPEDIDGESVGNLDVALLDSNGNTLVASAEPNSIDEGDEKIVWGVDAKDDFLIHVRGTVLKHRNPETGRDKEFVNYDLEVNVRDPKSCSGDSLEPNNTRDKAKKIEAGKSYDMLEVCGDDKDFYKLEAKQNQNVEVVAEAPYRLGDIDLTLYDAQGNVISAEDTNKDVEKLTYATREAETLFVEVKVTNGTGLVGYKLGWAQSDNKCADTFETNDTCPPMPGAASFLKRTDYTGGTKTLSNLTVCTDADYYAIDLLPLDELTVKTRHDRREGQLQLTMFGPDSCQTFVQSASSKDLQNNVKELTLNYKADTGGTFYLLAQKFGGPGNVPYKMDVGIKAGPKCQDDGSEPNDTVATGTKLDRNKVMQGLDDSALVGRQICDKNQDYYCVDLNQNDTVKWDVRFSNNEGNLDAFIVGPNGNTKASGVTSSDNEQVTHQAQSQGTYCLKVAGKTPVRNDYNVMTFINGQGTADPNCPDVYENNDQCTAMNCTAKELQTGQEKSLLVCGSPYDPDWYKTKVKAGETVTVKASFTNSKGNIDLTLYEEGNLNRPVDRSQTANDTEEVSAFSNKDQTFFYRLNSQRGGPSNFYDLDVSKSGPTQCTDDGSEPNNTHKTATDATVPGQMVALRKCEDDADWFEVTLNDKQKFRVFANYAASEGDLDLELYEDQGQNAPKKVASSTSNNDDEELDYTYTGGGSKTHYVKVISKVRARVDYDLLFYRDTDDNGSIDLGTDGPADQECPDVFENNDKAGEAAKLSVQKYEDLLMCAQNFSSDQDFYEVYVPSGATLTTAINKQNTQSGKFDVRLYRGSVNFTNVVAQGQTSSNKATVSHKNTGQGTTYFLEIDGINGPFRAFYSLDVKLAFSGMCNEDQFAGNNNSKQNAQALQSKDYDMGDGLMLCENTEDWFTFTPSANGQARFAIEYTKNLGAIGLEVQDAQGNSVGTVKTPSDYNGNVRVVTPTLQSGQTYYLKVAPANGGTIIRNAYDLWAHIPGDSQPTEPYCPDPFERNDEASLDVATSIDPTTKMQYPEVLACGTEEDWFQMDLNSSRTYDLAAFFKRNAASDIGFKLVDGNGNVQKDTNGKDINYANRSNDWDETVTFKPPSNGTYLLGIKNHSADEATPLLEVVDNAAACPEDQYDTGNNSNNNSFGAAALPAERFGLYALASCQGSNQQAADHFTYTAQKDGLIRVTVRFNSTRMTVGGFVFDANGQRSKMSANGNLLRHEVKNVTKGDQIEIVVQAVNSTEGPYYLNVQNF